MASIETPLTAEFLIKIYNIRFPLAKDAERVNWQEVWDLNWDTPSPAKRALFAACKPVWKQLSQQPLNIDLPSADHPKYIEQCMALIWFVDQPGMFFRGKDIRWSASFFRPAADKIALALYRALDSPFKKEAWLKRGWSFEDYIAWMTMLWAPLIHSEQIMTEHWTDIHKVILHDVRREVEAYTGKPDPGAPTEEQDEADVQLFDKLITDPPPTVSDMADFMYPMLRITTAHVPIINKFGRYPYHNDAVGRDFQPGEEEWMAGTVSFNRMDPTVRDAIRHDVDAGAWSPLRLDYDLNIAR